MYLSQIDLDIILSHWLSCRCGQLEDENCVTTTSHSQVNVTGALTITMVLNVDVTNNKVESKGFSLHCFQKLVSNLQSSWLIRQISLIMWLLLLMMISMITIMLVLMTMMAEMTMIKTILRMMMKSTVSKFLLQVGQSVRPLTDQGGGQRSHLRAEIFSPSSPLSCRWWWCCSGKNTTAIYQKPFRGCIGLWCCAELEE